MVNSHINHTQPTADKTTWV